MFSTKTLLLTLVLTSVACAPRVSKRAPEKPQAAAPVKAQPVAVAPVQQARSQPVSTPQPAPVATVAVAQKSEPAPVQKAVAQVEQPVEEEAPAEENDEGYAAEEAKPAASSKKSFYAYSDDEITQMRRRSREFKKLHDKLNSCTSKSERNIAKREQLRDKIIALQNTEYRTPRQDKELLKLRADERKMLSGRADNTQDCHALEGRLTEMLRATYTRGA
jgi:hypothetical protein